MQDNKIINDTLDIQLAQNRGLVVDRRTSPAKYVGIILRLGNTFTFCPFLRKHLFFSQRVPKFGFRSPERAWHWLQRHTVGYAKSRNGYTPFNIFIWYLYQFPTVIHGFSEMRVQLILMQVGLAAICLIYEPPSPRLMVSIIAKGVAGAFFVSALVNIYRMFKPKE